MGPEQAKPFPGQQMKGKTPPCAGDSSASLWKPFLSPLCHCTIRIQLSLTSSCWDIVREFIILCIAGCYLREELLIMVSHPGWVPPPPVLIRRKSFCPKPKKGLRASCLHPCPGPGALQKEGKRENMNFYHFFCQERAPARGGKWFQ